jgi:N-acetylneuraminate synthase
MSSWAELDEAVGRLKDGASDLVVMQCTSEYPCPPTKIGLNLITEIRDRYRCKVGLSDHSGVIYAGLAAATMKICALEVHVTFSRAMYGPDVPASVTFEELRQLVNGIRFIETALACKVDKDRVATEKSELRNIFGKSVVAANDLPAGAVLREVDLALRKPGTGIPARQWNQVIGRRLTRAVARNHPIAFDDIE